MNDWDLTLFKSAEAQSVQNIFCPKIGGELVQSIHLQHNKMYTFISDLQSIQVPGNNIN